MNKVEYGQWRPTMPTSLKDEVDNPAYVGGGEVRGVWGEAE